MRACNSCDDIVPIELKICPRCGGDVFTERVPGEPETPSGDSGALVLPFVVQLLAATLVGRLFESKVTEWDLSFVAFGIWFGVGLVIVVLSVVVGAAASAGKGGSARRSLESAASAVIGLIVGSGWIYVLLSDF